MGMLKMVVEGKHHLHLRRAFQDAFEVLIKTPALSSSLAQELSAKKEEIVDEIFVFLANRFRTILGEYGFEKDEIEAVLARGIDDPYDLYCKAKSLHAFRKTEHSAFLATHQIYTRAKKILLSQNPNLLSGWKAAHVKAESRRHNRFEQVNPTYFKDPSEERLFHKIQEIKQAFHTSLIDRREASGHNWGEAFALLSELKGPVSSLFEHVKIIDEDASVRANRLALLQEVWDLCEELADFSKIQEHEHAVSV